MSEASVIYQELGERHNWTAQLYNGAAACAMQLGNWEEAEQYLQVVPTPLSNLQLESHSTEHPSRAPLHMQSTVQQCAFA